MASSGAQAYFATFTPEQQAQIRKSWGGADQMDAWFQAAVNAGTATPEGARLEGQGASTTAAHAGNMSAAQLRQKAKAENWSEDFERFDDNTLQGWINQYWDPERGRFRSQHAPEGASGDWVYVDKPTESVRDQQGNEWGPHGTRSGVNLTALGLGGGGAGGGGGGAGGASYGAQAGGGPLQQMLVNMLQNQGSFIGEYDQNKGDGIPGVQGGQFGSGGIWYQPTQQGPQMSNPDPMPMPQMGGIDPLERPPQAQPGPGGIITPRPGVGGLPAPRTPGLAGIAPPIVPGAATGLTGMMGGVSQSPYSQPLATGGLAGMMKKKQQPNQRQGGWFGGGL